MSKSGKRDDQSMHKAKLRDAVVKRDREICTCCRRSLENVSKFDVDHNVPRGAGGSDILSNQSALCRQCHRAKHGEGLAPTIELQSTGSMDKLEFMLFKQFFNEMIPALAREFGVRLVPKFRLDTRDVWHLPEGDMRRLDSRLADEEPEYSSFQASEYM